MIATAFARSAARVEISVFKDGRRLGHAIGRLAGHDIKGVLAEKTENILRTARLPGETPARTVEGDFAAVLLALDADRAQAPFLAVELGTGATLALVKPGTNPILTARTTTPLVFDGEGVGEGRGPFRGAIDRVAFSGGAIRAHVIGDPENVFATAAGNNRNRARGICGQGLVSAAAALRAANLSAGAIMLRDGIGLTPDDLTAVATSVKAVRAEVDRLIAATGIPAAGLRVVVAGLGAGADAIDAGTALGLWPADVLAVADPNPRLRGAEILLRDAGAASRHHAIRARLQMMPAA